MPDQPSTSAPNPSDGQFAQRRFQLEQSVTTTGTTTFIEHMTPGTTVPPHTHSRFSETFDLISGSITVFVTPTPPSARTALSDLEASASPLKPGQPVTVPPGQLHQYVVNESSEPTVLRCTLSPGDANFERLLMIMNGLARDGRLEELGTSLDLMAIAMELSDATPIGHVGEMLEGVRRERGQEVERLKGELLGRYDTEEGLRELLGE